MIGIRRKIAIVHSNAPGRYISTSPPSAEAGGATSSRRPASLRLLALALAGTSLLVPAALDRLTAPAFTDDGGNGNHGGKGNGGNGNGGGNNGGGGNLPLLPLDPGYQWLRD